MRLSEVFARHGCDRAKWHGYDAVYETLPEPFRLLEIGIFRGAGIASWLDWFPKADIVGVDTFQRLPPERIPALNFRRVSWYKGDSQTIEVPGTFDIIIDDGCHKAAVQLETYRNLGWKLNPGGVYFIEDVWPLDPGFDALIDGLPDNAIHHDFREGRKPDSYLIEIR